MDIDITDGELDDLIDMVEEQIEFHQIELNSAVGEVLSQVPSFGNMQMQYVLLQRNIALRAKLQAAKHNAQ